MLVEPATTWLFVSTSPDEESTIPVPAARPFWYPSTVLMSTTAGSTFVAIALVSAGPGVARTAGAGVPPPRGPGPTVGAGGRRAPRPVPHPPPEPPDTE